MPIFLRFEDRLAIAIIEDAEKKGELKPGAPAVGRNFEESPVG